MVNSTPSTSDDTGDIARMEALVRTIRSETDALLQLLPDAYARQWEASPVPRPREDTTQRAIGTAPSDPTADTVLDARRLALRGTTSRAERVLEHAAQALLKVAVNLNVSIARFDGDEPHR